VFAAAEWHGLVRGPVAEQRMGLRFAIVGFTQIMETEIGD
jgi:hypothetical protein